jgi:hypothetical protein
MAIFQDSHRFVICIWLLKYITKLYSQQAQVIQNHENANVRNIGQGEARQIKYTRLTFGGGQAYDRSSD